MALYLRIENETSLPDGGPIELRVSGRRGVDIGRDSHLDWSLPDPTRYISSKHCEVRYEKGGYVLYDVSTNGTFLNGSDRRMAGPHRLKTGDRIIIGNYIVAVEVDASDVADTAKARPVTRAADPWDIASSVPPVDRKDVIVPVDRRPNNDPLNWAVDMPDIVPAERKSPSRQYSPPVLPDPPSRRMPDVWNDHQPPPPPIPAPLFSPSTLPVPGSPPPMPGPLVDDRETKAIPILRKPPDAVAPKVDFGERVVRQEALSIPVPPVPPVADARAAKTSQPASPAQAAGVAELMARFARGAGIPAEDLLKRDAGDIMEDLGGMMRLVVDNLMELNADRRETKRVMRSSDHTVIRGHDNNPLKFMPTPEHALISMIDQPTRSYLNGPQALKESFDDLQNHQKRIFVAMRQAMKMLFEDMDPAVIDKSVEGDRGVASLIGGSRKTRLWDNFVARWQAKTRRSEDGMVGLFMLYFSDCYDRLGDSKDPPDRLP
jgi:type VI secretion system protein ImpI